MLVKKKFFSIKSIKPKGIVHGFFTRMGGYSKKQFTSLNCSISNGDSKNLVHKNKMIAIKNLKISSKKLILAKQTHSSKVERVKKNNQNQIIQADGLITSSKDIAIAVLTADCAPIFIFDNNNKFVCCLHSGWRGTLKNITKNAVKLFNKYNIKTKDLIAIVGPCLASKNYEVDKNFEKQFLQKNNR